jgi:hypothetical protein
MSDQPAFSLRFPEVDALLAAQNMIASDKRIAFQGRVKAMLRLNLLPHLTLGRGRAASYSALDVVMLQLGLELLQLGLSPERAVASLIENRQIAELAIWAARKAVQDPQSERASYITFDPSGFDTLQDKSFLQGIPHLEGDRATSSFKALDDETISRRLTLYGMALPRVALVNVSIVVSTLHAEVWHLRGEADARNFAESLFSDAEERVVNAHNSQA